MNFDTLTKPQTERAHSNLANVETAKLKQMRSAGLRNCFQHINETRFRMEFVAKIHDKEFINDAMARNVNATWYALESTKGDIIWIANNGELNEPEKLRRAAEGKVRMLISLGGLNPSTHEMFSDIIPVIEEASTMHSALTKALYSDIEKAKVLFSPAVANNVPAEVQGEEFRHEVNEL